MPGLGTAAQRSSGLLNRTGLPSDGATHKEHPTSLEVAGLLRIVTAAYSGDRAQLRSQA
jgi:hypothetical protein